MRLIDADALQNEYKQSHEGKRLLLIDVAPTIEPEPKKGKWIDYSDEGFVECPFCHSVTNCDGNKEELHYCFSCGADMREGRGDSMMYQLIQRVKRVDGTRWVHWTEPLSGREFTAAMEYFHKNMVSEWYKNGFLICVIDENNLSFASLEKWLRENGFID